MLETFKQLFEVIGFECSIKNDYDGNRLELTYVNDDELGNYKFLKIRDVINCSVENLINEVGFDYIFTTFADGFYIIDQVGSEDV